jgi:hypothetical protein
VATWAPLFAAIIAAAVAVLGYGLTNRSKQLDARAKAYADALTAIEAYKSLPYRIMRCTVNPEDRADVQHLVSDVEQQVAFFRRWLALESARVGLSYEALANKVMQRGADYRGQAWGENARRGDHDPATFPIGFDYKDQFEQGVCLAAMRHDLGRRRRVPSSKISQPSSVGTSFNVQDSEGNTYRITLVKFIDPAEVKDQQNTSINGNRFVGAAFEIKALNGALRNENANKCATLVGSNGQTYTASPYVITGYTNFSNGNINVDRGGSVTVAVTFEVPASVTASNVQWAPEAGFGIAFRWRLP